MVRLSLRTASPQQARSRAAELDLAKDAMMEQMPILRRNVKAEDMPALYKRAFERELDRVIMAQFHEPGRVDEPRTQPDACCLLLNAQIFAAWHSPVHTLSPGRLCT